MTLEFELNALKAGYRSYFIECAKEIEFRLNNGDSIDLIEKLYKQKWTDYLEEIANYLKKCNCVGCGVCCKFAVSEFSPEELTQKAQQGDNFAKQFISTFQSYKSLDAVKEVYPEYVELLQNLAQGSYYFYHCPKVTKDNRCPDYENRPQICRDFPDNPIAFLPKTCGFLPWKLKSQSVCLKLNAEKEIIDFYRKGNL